MIGSHYGLDTCLTFLTFREEFCDLSDYRRYLVAGTHHIKPRWSLVVDRRETSMFGSLIRSGRNSQQCALSFCVVTQPLPNPETAQMLSRLRNRFRCLSLYEDEPGVPWLYPAAVDFIIDAPSVRLWHRDFLLGLMWSLWQQCRSAEYA